MRHCRAWPGRTGQPKLFVDQTAYRAELTITKILVRDLQKERPGVDRSLLTIHPEKVIENGCDMVVELVGGIEPARSFIQQSLACRKHVVTANKALLALDGFGLMKAGNSQGAARI